jgi:hypothetical protein
VGEVLGRVRQRDELIKTLKGNGDITVESPEASNSGSFEVDVKKPDSLLVELNGPFGIHVGTLALSPQQFIFYNWRDHHAIIGKPDGTTLQSMFRITLSHDEILKLFTGEFLSYDERDSLEQFSVVDGLYVVRFLTHDGVKEYRIDPEAFTVAGYRLLDTRGKAIVIALASRFDAEQDVSMPRVLRIIAPEDHRSITIAYGDVKLNQPVRCSFTLPQQAQVDDRR